MGFHPHFCLSIELYKIMKKLIYSSIAFLAAIVVMGSCSQDSDLTSTTSSSSEVDSVTVSLNLNSGIEVSESGSAMSKSSDNIPVTRAATRAGSTDYNGNFKPAPDGITYTAYFVAKETGNGYTAGNIVSIQTVNEGSNNTVKVPNIAYTIYVTNYSDDNIKNLGIGSLFIDKAFKEYSLTTAATLADNDVKDGTKVKIPLPVTNPTEATSTLYLFGETTSDAATSGNTIKATVDLYTPYAAVAVSKTNTSVTGAAYNYSSSNADQGIQYVGSTGETGDEKGWYYLYIIADGGYTTANYSEGSSDYTDYSWIDYNDKYTNTGLNNKITAGNIYQYTVSQNGTLTVKINAFGNAQPTQELDLNTND